VFSTTDTIVAIATPTGHGGIGIVRLSGPDAVAIATRLTRRTAPLTPRGATFARIVDRRESGSPDSSDRARTLDEVVLTWFQAPRSYTGDDVVEIAAHGSPLVLRSIVERALQEGARLAEPGEFTLRAYLNGRLDLVQAEAVADLVASVTPLQARTAMDQLEGTLTQAIAGIESSLFDLAARLEASIDFPEEGFHFITRDEAQAELANVDERLQSLIRNGRRGRLIREGALVSIAGRPNVGKSSLFNALVGTGRAIVTDVPGTTRDLLSERVDICGAPVTLVDTAGVRTAGDAIEAEGVRRARAAHEVAALVLVVVDGSAPLSVDDHTLISASPSRLIVINKSDLSPAWSAPDLQAADDEVAVVSAATGVGLDELRGKIGALLTGHQFDSRDTPAISNVRHLELVGQARDSVGRAREALSAGATEETVLADLAMARTSLEAVVGRHAPDDLLEHVFSRFCVGK
jgi:tRNA modification GTPase